TWSFDKKGDSVMFHLRCNLAAAAALCCLCSAPTALLAQTTTIALTDQAVPEGNGQFSAFGDPVLNAAGRVAFRADLNNTGGSAADDSGIYLYDGTSLVNRVRENAAVPEGNGLF